MKKLLLIVIAMAMSTAMVFAGDFDPRPTQGTVKNSVARRTIAIGQQGNPSNGASGEFDFLAEFTARIGINDSIRIDNTGIGGTFVDDVFGGHMRMTYRDSDGVRGEGQFADDRFFTFCAELQAVRGSTRGFDLISITSGPNPSGGEGVEPYDILDDAELHAVIAGAIRLGWINADLSATDITTDAILSAIQAGIWRVLFDDIAVTPLFAEVADAIAVLEAETALEPSARVIGLRLMANPDTQDMLYVLPDDSPPDVYCDVEVIADGSLCPCDLDMDGALTDADLMDFFDGFGLGDADFNNDGVTDFLDFLDFLACFNDPTGNCGQIAGDGDCCSDAEGDGIKPAVLRVQYTGADCGSSSHSQSDDKFSCEGDPMGDEDVYILVTDKSDPHDDRAKVWFSGAVALGEVFDISSFNAGRDQLKSKTFVYVYSNELCDVLLQSIEFHTSCSQPLFSGDTFGSIRLLHCFDENGEPAGGDSSDDDNVDVSVVKVHFSATDSTDDPSDIDIVGTIDTGCEIIEVEDGQVIEIRCFNEVDPGSEDFCENGFGKPSTLTLTYTGEDCDATDTTQDSGKYSCWGDPEMNSLVYVVVADRDDPWDDRAKIFFSGFVGLDEAFVANAENAGENKLSSKTFVSVFNNEFCDVLLQRVEFHTSCSQPLRIGDQYGSIRIDGATNEHGESVGSDSLLVCGSEYIDGRLVITTSGATLTVTATDSSGNQAICEKIICEPSEDIGDPEDCCADGSKPTALSFRYTGNDCEATSTSQDEGKYECWGDPEMNSEVYIVVSDRDDPWNDRARIYFAGFVSLDEVFEATAEYAGEDKFRSKTFVTIFTDETCDVLLQQVEFHTSCSQPLFVGDVYGAVEITACRSD